MRLVLDASVTLCWMLGDGTAASRAYAGRVLERMKAEDTQAVVPVIWGLEIANVIARAEGQEIIDEAQSEAFLALLGGLDIDMDPETGMQSLTQTLALARRHRLSAYDAAYLELSLRTGLSLATLDQGLQKAAQRAGVARFG